MLSNEKRAIELRMFPRRIFSSLPRVIKKGIYAIVHKKRIADWNAKGNPVPPPHAIKQSTILEYQQKYGCTTMIETGTFMGDMLEAVQYNFDKIYSIELVEFIQQLTSSRFKNRKNIKILQGDSSNVLPSLVEKLKEPTLFWLDGHYSGGDTGYGEKACPVYAEMDTIFKSPYKHIILIDDARCFMGEIDYPPLDEFISYVNNHERKTTIEVKHDIIRIVLL